MYESNCSPNITSLLVKIVTATAIYLVLSEIDVTIYIYITVTLLLVILVIYDFFLCQMYYANDVLQTSAVRMEAFFPIIN